MALPELPLPIAQVKFLPRRVKRRIWRGWWQHRRADVPGDNRQDKRRNWRALWGLLRVPNRGW